MTSSLTLRAALVSVLHLPRLHPRVASRAAAPAPCSRWIPEYAKLMGLTATQGKSAMPGPLDVGAKLWEHVRRPFYDNGPNDKGVGIQLAYSIARVALGYLLAVLVAIPIGFLIGMSPLFSKALDPFIQVLKPISPLAWMPLALYTIKDSALSAIFVIFICSLWPMLINTAFGVAARAQGMAQRRAHAGGRHVAPRLHDHPARRGADDPHRHAHLDRHRVARHRRGRDARRRDGHWLLRLERME